MRVSGVFILQNLLFAQKKADVVQPRSRVESRAVSQPLGGGSSTRL